MLLADEIGLEILGFRDEMKKHIDHFEELIVVKEKLTATNVLNTLSFQDKVNADEENTKVFIGIFGEFLRRTTEKLSYTFNRSTSYTSLRDG